MGIETAAMMTIGATAAKSANSFINAAGTSQAAKLNAINQDMVSQIEAGKLERAAKVAELKGSQTSVQFREELNKTLAGIRLVRATAGTDPDSPTGIALLDKATEDSTRQRMIAEQNFRREAAEDRADAKLRRYYGQLGYQTARSTARLAMLGATLGSVGNFLSLGSSGYGGGGGGPGDATKLGTLY